MPPGATSHNAPIAEARGAMHATGLQNNLMCKSYPLLDRTADSIHNGGAECVLWGGRWPPWVTNRGSSARGAKVRVRNVVKPSTGARVQGQRDDRARS